MSLAGSVVYLIWMIQKLVDVTLTCRAGDAQHHCASKANRRVDAQPHSKSTFPSHTLHPPHASPCAGGRPRCAGQRAKTATVCPCSRHKFQWRCSGRPNGGNLHALWQHVECTGASYHGPPGCELFRRRRWCAWTRIRGVSVPEPQSLMCYVGECCERVSLRVKVDVKVKVEWRAGQSRWLARSAVL